MVVKTQKFVEISEAAAQSNPPAWLSFDKDALSGTVLALPTREEIDAPVTEQLVIELYSR